MTNRLFRHGDKTALLFVIDGGGAEISTGLFPGDLKIPFPCYLEEVQAEGGPSGSIVVDIWKCTRAQWDAGSTHPVNGDSITSSTPLTISAGTKVQDSTLAGWTRLFSEDDLLAFNVDSISTIEYLAVAIKLWRL